MTIYKCSCEFYVKANEESEVEEKIALDTDNFVESHILVEETDLPKNEELWADYTKEQLLFLISKFGGFKMEKEFIDLGKKVEIPFYYALDDEGNVIIDVESMNKEFEEKMEILSNIIQKSKEE